MGLKNKSKRYMDKHLTPEVQEIMGFNNAYWENKKQRRLSTISNILITLGVAGSIVACGGLGYANEKYAEIMDNTEAILNSITSTQSYIEAKKQYENLMFKKYDGGEISFEEFEQSIKNYSNDTSITLNYASREQIEEIEDNIEESQKYKNISNACLGAGVPLMSATGVGTFVSIIKYLGAKSKEDEYDFHDDIDLSHY